MVFPTPFAPWAKLRTLTMACRTPRAARKRSARDSLISNPRPLTIRVRPKSRTGRSSTLHPPVLGPQNDRSQRLLQLVDLVPETGQRGLIYHDAGGLTRIKSPHQLIEVTAQ